MNLVDAFLELLSLFVVAWFALGIVVYVGAWIYKLWLSRGSRE